MEKISSSIKCGNCFNIFEFPVFLPCGDSICQKHTIDCQGSISCLQCGRDHELPASGTGFPLNKGLASLITDAQLAHLDFGIEHKEATRSCEHFDDILTKIEQLLNDPFMVAYETIEYLKSVVQLKGEEMIFRIHENMGRAMNVMDEYKNELKNSFSEVNFKIKSEMLRQENEMARNELKKWLVRLNEVRVDLQEWKRIKGDSEKAIAIFGSKLAEFKVELFPRRFDEFTVDIKKNFGPFEVDPKFDLR
jgi:hypothetical protein